MSTAREVVENTRTRIFWGCVFLVIFTSVWMGFISAATLRLKHTWEQPAISPGNLLTYAGGKDHMLFIGIQIVPWVVIILLVFLIAYPDKDNRGTFEKLHFIMSLLIWVFLLSCLVIWGLVDWRSVNLQTAANAANLFNDDRWCLVNFAIANVFCANTAAPQSGSSQYLINQASLGTNGIMLTVFWMLFAFWFFTGIQIIYVRRSWIPALNVFYNEQSNNGAYTRGGEEKEDYYEAPPPLPPQKETTLPPSAPNYYFDDYSKTGRLLSLPTRFKNVRK